MDCNKDKLQEYLDGEMDAQQVKELNQHLVQCPFCRRELGQLKLIWYELESVEEVSLPLELPFIRQQVIHQVMHQPSAKELPITGYWDRQKLAWQPALHGASFIPGIGLISSATRFTGQQVPRLLSSTGRLAKRLFIDKKKPKGGRP